MVNGCRGGGRPLRTQYFLQSHHHIEPTRAGAALPRGQQASRGPGGGGRGGAQAEPAIDAEALRQQKYLEELCESSLPQDLT